MSRRSRILLAAATAVFVGLVLAPGEARAGFTEYRSFTAVVEVQDDGTLSVTETVSVEFTAARHGIFRDLPVKYEYEPDPDRLRVTEVDVLAVTRNGSPEPFEEQRSGSQREWLRLKIGDADRTISGPHEYRIRYEVRGALNSFPTHEELFWNVTGDGWEGAFERADVVVTGPSIIRGACESGSGFDCAAGEASPERRAWSATHVGSFGADMTVVVGFAPGAVDVPAPVIEKKWSPLDVFAATPANVGLGIVAAGAMTILLVTWLKRGRDERALRGLHEGGLDADDAPVQFRPPDGLRPAHLGLLDDETVNPIDVGATIVDLAVRGHLVLEDRRETGDDEPDWVVMLPAGKGEGDDLEPYERRLLKGLARESSANELRLADLEGDFHPDFQAVSRLLYEDAVARGWFRRRPDRVRNRYRIYALVALAVSGVALVGVFSQRLSLAWPVVAVAAFGLVGLVVARFMPAKTAGGTEALIHTRGFKKFIETAERPEMNYAAEQGEFVRFLPYAIAFGAVDAWVRAAAGLDVAAATAGWYSGPVIHSWGSFGSSFDGIGKSVGSAIAAAPAASGGSGFSGGGFSGGGFGGGGGGSW